VLALAALSAVHGPVAADAEDDIVVRPKWHHIVTKPGAEFLINLAVENNGRSAVSLSLEFIETPGEDWEGGIRGALTNYPVVGVSLAPSDERSMPLEFKVPDDAAPGDYRWVLRAAAADGSFEKLREILMTVKAAESEDAAEALPGILEMAAPRYSSLSGSADSDFEFNFSLKNGTEETVVLDLGGRAPESWTLEFLPAFGSQDEEKKKITSLSLEEGSSETIVVRVRPLRDESPGQYGIEFTATGGDRPLSAVFQVEIVGSIELQVAPQTGRLTAEAVPGEATTYGLVVANIGNEVVSTIDLISRPPEGWLIEFSPPDLRFVGRDEQKEVQVLVTPPEDAAAGDYLVTLIAHSEGVTDSLDLMVTISEESVMGWVWAAIALIALVCLGVLTYRLRRS
jgi:uncharacterized membrane protein